MNREQILEFIKWLKLHDMQIAGYCYNQLLGVNRLQSLAEEDYEIMITDFLKDQSK